MEAAQVPVNRWVDEKAVAPIYNEILLGHRKEQNFTTHDSVGGSRGHYAQWSKSVRERHKAFKGHCNGNSGEAWVLWESRWESFVARSLLLIQVSGGGGGGWLFMGQISGKPLNHRHFTPPCGMKPQPLTTPALAGVLHALLLAGPLAPPLWLWPTY